MMRYTSTHITNITTYAAPYAKVSSADVPKNAIISTLGSHIIAHSFTANTTAPFADALRGIQYLYHSGINTPAANMNTVNTI